MNPLTNAVWSTRSLIGAQLLSLGIVALAGPTGGTVVVGGATIQSINGKTTVTQSTQNTAINWQLFNIAPHESVQYVQPSSSSVALNRVLSSDPSSIQGNLSANGKVFLINPNGILFGQGAVVNVGGLVASTLNLSNDAFMRGNFDFNGLSQGTVRNEGRITANGGHIVFLGRDVGNTGRLIAHGGAVVMAAGEGIALNGPGTGMPTVTVTRGAVNAQASNRGWIQADGGNILLTAQALSGPMQGVVNNTGVLQARTLDKRAGSIKLLGDMRGGTVNAGGTLDTSAPIAGDGGFVETSAAQVKIAPDVIVTSQAAIGKAGTWLIDPVDFTVGAGGDILGSTLSGNLVTSNVTILSSSGATGVNGDIHVNEAVTWTASGAPTTLTLNAVRDININAAITATQGSLVLLAANDVNVNAAVTTTDGSLNAIAGRAVNIDNAALTTTRGNLLLSAGNDGSGTGSVLFAAGTPPAAVTGPGTVKIYNPVSYSTPIDYSSNMTLTSGATLAQYTLVFLTGLTGATGATGPVGPSGATGANGATGIAGAIGATGAIGAVGPMGATGATGANGIIGATGATGSTGATGLAGTAGATGATGSTGATGLAGTAGATGAAGPSGTVGPAGTPGLVGLTGASGATGAAGATGSTGTDGIDGSAGATGATGSTGSTGATGLAGTAGATGAAGPSGSVGPAGTPGLVGLTGASGATGAAGATGSTGTDGIDGIEGHTGATGAIGSTGDAGPPGVAGPAGPRGDTGTTGPTASSVPEADVNVFHITPPQVLAPVVNQKFPGGAWPPDDPERKLLPKPLIPKPVKESGNNLAIPATEIELLPVPIADQPSLYIAPNRRRIQDRN